MKWALLSVVLAGSAWAQGNACQQKCMSRDCSSSCSDDRCMKRCNSQIQSCVVSCEKSIPKDELTKHQAYKGNCPGPRGQMVPCDASKTMDSAQEMMKARAARDANRSKKEHDQNFPHSMPSADNYKEMYEKNKKAQQNQ